MVHPPSSIISWKTCQWVCARIRKMGLNISAGGNQPITPVKQARSVRGGQGGRAPLPKSWPPPCSGRVVGPQGAWPPLLWGPQGACPPPCFAGHRGPGPPDILESYPPPRILFRNLESSPPQILSRILESYPPPLEFSLLSRILESYPPRILSRILESYPPRIFRI